MDGKICTSALRLILIRRCRRNMLFVNQGLDASGEPVFKELAAQYKIDYAGHSIMAAFFDSDRDGDLDLYILQNQKLNKRAH